MLVRLHEAISDRVAGHTGFVFAAAAALMLASLPIVALGTRLDMSFRPLFAREPAEEAATAVFEARFGNGAGTQTGIVIDPGRPLDVEVLQRVAALSLELSQLDHVVELVSPAMLAGVVMDSTGTRGRWLLDPNAIRDSRPAADSALTLLRSDQPALRALVGPTGHMLLLARIDLPLTDLHGRNAVIARMERLSRDALPAPARVHMTGVSVVEAAYARAVPVGMARSLVATTIAVLLVLLALHGSAAAAAVCLAGVAVAVPITLAVSALAGQPITLLSSMAPTVILIVGVADAIHMMRRWQTERVHASSPPVAVRRMMAAMALPCLLTTVTTALGFLALRAARINAIGDFGDLAALGVVLVYLANLVLVPALLHRFGARIRLRRLPKQSWLARLPARFAGAVVRRPATIIAGAAVCAAAGGAGVQRLRVDQRVNEELPATHPVRAAQTLLEREFDGVYGPALELRALHGSSALSVAMLTRVAALRDDIAALPHVDGVGSALELLPPTRTHADSAALAALRADALLGARTRELTDGHGGLALQVRIGDIGTRAALALADTMQSLARHRLGPSMEARVVGQWWLAQRGMSSLLRDMLMSFITSAVLVLPVLAVALRSRRLFLIALPPNLLPMLAALAFMGWAGITLRIGTALVLAVALAIAVDDTIHLLAHVEEERRRRTGLRAAVLHALRASTPPLVATTAVLAAGFLSMLGSSIAAIRDMGLVATVTLVTALLCDLLLAPALYLLLATPAADIRHPGAVTTPSDRSNALPHAARLVAGGYASTAAHEAR